MRSKVLLLFFLLVAGNSIDIAAAQTTVQMAPPIITQVQPPIVPKVPQVQQKLPQEQPIIPSKLQIIQGMPPNQVPAPGTPAVAYLDLSQLPNRITVRIYGEFQGLVQGVIGTEAQARNNHYQALLELNREILEKYVYGKYDFEWEYPKNDPHSYKMFKARSNGRQVLDNNVKIYKLTPKPSDLAYVTQNPPPPGVNLDPNQEGPRPIIPSPNQQQYIPPQGPGFKPGFKPGFTDAPASW